MDDVATESVEVSWTRDRAEARALARALQARSRRGFVRLRALAALVLVLAVLAPLPAGPRFAVGVLAGTFLLLLFLLPSLVVLLVEVNARAWAIGALLSVRMTPSGVLVDGPFGRSRYAWPDVTLERTATLLVGRQRTGTSFAVPLRLLDGTQVDRVLAWSQETGVAGPGAEPGTDPVPDDAVGERPDTVVVTAPLTVVQAHRLTSNGVRPRDVVVVALAVVVVAALVRWGGGPLPAVASTVAVYGTAGVVLAVVLNWFAAWRLVRRLGGASMTWEFSPVGVTTTTPQGRIETPWRRVERFALRGDMLVLRATGVRARLGALVGPLAAEERDRVLAWAAAGSSAGGGTDR